MRLGILTAILTFILVAVSVMNAEAHGRYHRGHFRPARVMIHPRIFHPRVVVPVPVPVPPRVRVYHPHRVMVSHRRHC